MQYPNCPEKYQQNSLLNPKDFVRYANYPSKMPQKILITFDPDCLKYFLNRYPNTTEIRLHEDLIIHHYQTIGFVRLPGIGGPFIAAAVEEMIALGAASFITVGTAGGLKKEGVFVCQKALREEGTSYHYLPAERYVEADEHLSTALAASLTRLGISYAWGTTWTTDAPYRETPVEVQTFAREGVDTVEMECASLFAVAKFRRVAAASVVVVGDVLSESWTPMFRNAAIQTTLPRLIDAAVNCLMELP
jgi:uridine phosphorylase